MRFSRSRIDVRTLSRIMLVIAVIATVTSVSAQSRRDWDDLYRDAIELVAQRQWKKAEDVLLQAIKAGPPSGRGQIKRVFGNDDYFPEYYLGVIYLNTNRPAEALTQFQAARKRGVNLRDREFQRLAEYEARAKELADAEASKRAAADRVQQFKRLVGDAQRLLGEGRYEDAETAAKQARALNFDNGLADGILQNIQKARSSSRLQDALKRNPALPELRRLLTEYESSGLPLDDLRERIATAERIERRNTAERAAMLAFYGGNYAQAITALNEAEKTFALTNRGQFYRAVTLAAQAVRGKEINQGLLQRARQAWQAANRNPGEFKTDLRYISPEILRQLQGK
jgi:hypothetical protein